MANSPFVVEVTAENFQEVVVEGSKKQPVLVDFWAAWCNPCQVLMPLLTRLAEEFGGKFILAKVNSDENQDLAGQYGVRSLPTVKLFKAGLPADEFMGALPEGQIREFLDRHLDRESDKLLQDAIALASAGQTENAINKLEEANAMDPGRLPIVLELAKLLGEIGRNEEAEALLNELSFSDKQNPQVTALLANLSLAKSTADMPPLEDLEARIAADENDLEAYYQAALQQIQKQDYEPAILNLLHIMEKDRTYEDDIGRKTLLQVFELLGDSPLVDTYRRKMFNMMY
ncbi:MAG: tetratricopeptide repeat protein [Thiotrichales bacterium]